MAKTTPKNRSKIVSKKDSSDGVTTRRRDGSFVRSQTTRYGGVTLVHQKYGLAKKTKDNFPEAKAAEDKFRTEVTRALAQIDKAVKTCKAKGDTDAVRELNEARFGLEKALRAKKPENRKYWYNGAKRSVLYAKQNSRAIANWKFFGENAANKI